MVKFIRKISGNLSGLLLAIVALLIVAGAVGFVGWLIYALMSWLFAMTLVQFLIAIGAICFFLVAWVVITIAYQLHQG